MLTRVNEVGASSVDEGCRRWPFLAPCLDISRSETFVNSESMGDLSPRLPPPYDPGSDKEHNAKTDRNGYERSDYCVGDSDSDTHHYDKCKRLDTSSNRTLDHQLTSEVLTKVVTTFVPRAV